MAVITDITFEAPEIGRRDYIVKGPSGWSETFKRLKADAELAKFIAPLEVDETVDLFLAARATQESKDVMGWYTITGFLGRMMSCTPKGVPHIVAVAFWGRVIIARETRETN